MRYCRRGWQRSAAPAGFFSGMASMALGAIAGGPAGKGESRGDIAWRQILGEYCESGKEKYYED